MSLHTISVLVEDQPGVLARVAGLFARRGFNIDSLAVGPTEEPGLSRMTIVVNVQHKPLEQVEKQLHKLINVLKVVEQAPGRAVERELALIKVRTAPEDRARIMEVAGIFRAHVVDVSTSTLTVEATGQPEKIEALRELLEPYGIVELARTGRVALARADTGIRGPRLRSAHRATA
jgi:acetolactate synthase-1/3 small subunit